MLGQKGQAGETMAGNEVQILYTLEIIHISSLSLLKILKFARLSTPLEVIGILLGEFIDGYSVKFFDVFAMPQTVYTVNVEAVDPVLQQNMLDVLKITGRHEKELGGIILIQSLTLAFQC